MSRVWVCYRNSGSWIVMSLLYTACCILALWWWEKQYPNQKAGTLSKPYVIQSLALHAHLVSPHIHTDLRKMGSPPPRPPHKAKSIKNPSMEPEQSDCKPNTTGWIVKFQTSCVEIKGRTNWTFQVFIISKVFSERMVFTSCLTCACCSTQKTPKRFSLGQS